MDIDILWDFDDPLTSETRFRAVADEAMTQVARALGLQGQFGAAHNVLDQLPEREGRIAVRILLERGRLFNSAKDIPHAAPLFLEAYELAVAIKEDALAVDAAHMVAITEKGDAALPWLAIAISLAASSEDPKAQKWRASLLNNLGWTHHDAGRFEEALKTFEEARKCREANGQVRQEQIARWCIARTLRSLGRHAEALVILRKLESEPGAKDRFLADEIEANLKAGSSS